MAAVITGANALLKISGDVVAFVGGVQVTHEQNLEEIPQLDSLEVAEYAENGHRCTVNVNTIKLATYAEFGGTRVSNSAAAFSLDHPNGELNQILLQPELIIEIVETIPILDGKGNTVDYTEAGIYTAYGAKFAGGAGQVDARGVWQGSWSFKCKRGVGI